MVGTDLDGAALTIATKNKMVVGSATSFEGGAAPATAAAQVVQFDILGPYNESTVYQILVGALTATKSGTIMSRAAVVKAYKQKVYAGNQSILNFCALNRPDYWVPIATDDSTSPAGAGFVDLATNGFGSEPITAISAMNQYMVFFAPHGIQVWSIDPDPAKNALVQPIENNGTRFSRSVQPYGGYEMGVVFLHDSGVRALRPQIYTGFAFMNDVGSAVDSIVTADMAALNQSQINSICSVITPIDFSYWLALGGKIYVLSYHPNAQIQAWSTFEPGFSVDAMVVCDQQVWVRSGDTLYLYGGADGQTYDDCQPEIVTQFSDGGDASAYKRLQSFDTACSGTWNAWALTDPRNLAVGVHFGEITGPTYRGGAIVGSARCNHVALRFVGSGTGPAKISSARVKIDPQNVS